MGKNLNTPLMPRGAMDAALDTFALIVRERHPGTLALTLGEVGPNGAVLASPPGQVLRPFAAPEVHDAIP